MQQLINQQILDLAFSELEIGMGIFDNEGRLLSANTRYGELLRHCGQPADATFPFPGDVWDELLAAVAADGRYSRRLTIDLLGRPTHNVFAGETYNVRARRLTGPDGQPAGMAVAVDETSEDARKGVLLDEFIFHRGLILDNTFAGLVYLNNDYEVMWKRLRNLWDDQFDRMYVEGSHCYESYGRTSPCGDCPILKSKQTGRVAKELRNMDDGTFIETLVIPVSKDGQVEGYIVHMSDVTERETMIEALRMAKDNVIENERLEEAFINNMNHEIRTPLNAIIGFNDILNGVAGEHMEESEKRLMKDHINKNADRLITLINDILDLSKMETGKLSVSKTVVSLREMCYKAREAVRSQLQPGVELKHEYPQELADTKLYTDGKRVEQLLRNVLSNACKHTKRGSITLGVSLVEDQSHRKLLQFSVTDTGVGIPHDKREELFTPFRKFHGATQGLGMGLAICKQIAHMLDGRIFLDHLYTHGSRFVFELPFEEMP